MNNVDLLFDSCLHQKCWNVLTNLSAFVFQKQTPLWDRPTAFEAFLSRGGLLMMEMIRDSPSDYLQAGKSQVALWEMFTSHLLPILMCSICVAKSFLWIRLGQAETNILQKMNPSLLTKNLLYSLDISWWRFLVSCLLIDFWRLHSTDC